MLQGQQLSYLKALCTCTAVFLFGSCGQLGGWLHYDSPPVGEFKAAWEKSEPI